MPASEFNLRLRKIPLLILMIMLSGIFITCGEKIENDGPSDSELDVSAAQRPENSDRNVIGDTIKEYQLLSIIDDETLKSDVENTRGLPVRQQTQFEQAEIAYNRHLALLNNAQAFLDDDSDALPLPPVDQGQQ